MYVVKPTSRYKKSLKRVSQYPSFVAEELDDVVIKLTQDVPLEPRYLDHELKGAYKGIRECHIRGDLLLLYKKQDDMLILLLVDIGTHASIFER
ncbi:type II toxin-antitoxin system YafQ family toxin [Candidatus Kaiserbacteria bacterium]|nr:type II toxin-antitoxin system YafQ family toxin [Candidatus Kaiserbacteria bacterium]